MARATFTWNGTEIKKRIALAEQDAINAIMAKAAAHAKKNHPGWRTITGLAQGSIDIVEFADHEKREEENIVGRWGSRGVSYMIWLELKHGSALRSAKDIWHPKLKAEVERRSNKYLKGLTVRA